MTGAGVLGRSAIHGLLERARAKAKARVKINVWFGLVVERIAVLLLRYYIVHEPVVSELRVVLQYCTVSDARVKSNP